MSTGRSRATPALPRKLRKLLRNPSAFLRDARLVHNLRTVLGGPLGVGLTPNDEADARLLASVKWRNRQLTCERWDRKNPEPGLTTVIAYQDDGRPLSEQPLLRDAFKSPDFVGFRERYLFGLAMDLGDSFRHLREIEDLFQASRFWERPLLAGVRNAAFLNPTNVLPQLLRSTNLGLRLILCVTREATNLELLQQLTARADVLVIERGVLARRPMQALRTIVVEDGSDLTLVLRQLIIDHKDKEKNAFVTIYGEPTFIEDIDDLLESEKDGVIGLDTIPSYSGASTFAEIVEDLTRRTRWLLLREERFHQFRDQCESGDLQRLLLLTLEDGCRYELRS